MNTREVQQHLKSLGWPIAVDGSYGPRTKAAVSEFQEGFAFWNLLVDGMAGPQTHNALRHSAARGGRAGEFFAFREFACNHCQWIKVDRELVRALDVLRRRYGPISVLSGYRCVTHNRAVGGAANSQHLYGNAADVRVGTLNAVRNLRLFSGLGHRAGAIRHVDVRHREPNTTGGTVADPTIWSY